MKFLFLTLFIFSPNLFAYTCYVYQDTSDIHSRYVNERKIYTLFKPPIEAPYENIFSILRNSIDNTDDLVDQLNNLLDRYPGAVQSKQTNVEYLTQLLESDQIIG